MVNSTVVATSTIDLLISDRFMENFDSLTAEQQKQTLDTIRKLQSNPHHPSLQAHRIHSARGKNIWECYINRGDRLVYQVSEDGLRLWYVGDHGLIDRIHFKSFAEHTVFRHINDSNLPPASTAADALAPNPQYVLYDASSTNAPVWQNPFEQLPAQHLRILGVPNEALKSVRTAASMDDIYAMEAIPAHTKALLMELVTSPIIFNPAQLLFRTTLDTLETYHEGQIKRLMLNLTAEQRSFVNLKVEGVALLRGCAGSGKTTIAIHRAVEAALSDRRVLFLTFNRALATAIRDLIAELINPLPETLEVTTIDAWATSYLEAQGKNLQFLTADDTKAIYTQIVDEQKQYALPPSPFLRSQWWGFYRDEIERVIKTNGLATLQAYLEVERIGRGQTLRSSERSYVWAVYERYQAALEAKGYNDWQDVPIVALRHLYAAVGRETMRGYDQIIVDEAQDMRLTQIQLIHALANPDSRGLRSIFMVGDSSQTLYTRGFTWRQAGLNIRGHSFKLRHNMRSSRQIASAAAKLSDQNHIFGSPAEIIDPQRCTRDGAKPIWFQPTTTQQEPHEVANKIIDLLSGDDDCADPDHALFRLSDFAILCPNHNLVQEYLTTLALKHIPCATSKGEKPFEVLENTVKVLTIHAAKGLEFPVVFIVGLHQGTLPRDIKTKIAEEYALELERSRILLYVAMTRAIEGLYLVASSSKPSQFLDEIGASAMVVERVQ